MEQRHVAHHRLLGLAEVEMLHHRAVVEMVLGVAIIHDPFIDRAFEHEAVCRVRREDVAQREFVDGTLDRHRALTS